MIDHFKLSYFGYTFVQVSDDVKKAITNRNTVEPEIVMQTKTGRCRCSGDNKSSLGRDLLNYAFSTFH